MKRLALAVPRYRLFLPSLFRMMASSSSSDGSSEQTFPRFATDAIHVGQEPEQWNCQAVVPLISLSTTFKQDGPAMPHLVRKTAI
jgi:hypothetical protein